MSPALKRAKRFDGPTFGRWVIAYNDDGPSFDWYDGPSVDWFHTMCSFNKEMRRCASFRAAREKSLSRNSSAVNSRFFCFFIGPRSPDSIYVSGLSNWVSPTPFWNLTDVTLADKETNLILTDKVNRVIQGNVAMQVTQPGGQVCNLCKWRHLMANIRTNASDLVETKMM